MARVRGAAGLRAALRLSDRLNGRLYRDDPHRDRHGDDRDGPPMLRFRCAYGKVTGPRSGYGHQPAYENSPGRDESPEERAPAEPTPAERGGGCWMLWL